MKTYLEPEEVQLIEQSTEYLRDKLLIRLLFHLGCRISEALGIKVSDIDFSQGRVTIQHLKARIELSCPYCNARLSKSHKFCPRCGLEVAKVVTQEKEHQRFRTLPVDETTLAVLKEYIKRDGPVSRNGKKFIKIRRKPRCSAAWMNALGAKLRWRGGLSGGVGLAEGTMLCVVVFHFVLLWSSRHRVSSSYGLNTVPLVTVGKDISALCQIVWK